MAGDELYTKRIDGPRQHISDAYSCPANFLEIEVVNPETHGLGRRRYTDYEIVLKVFCSIMYLVFSLILSLLIKPCHFHPRTRLLFSILPSGVKQRQPMKKTR